MKVEERRAEAGLWRLQGLPTCPPSLVSFVSSGSPGDRLPSMLANSVSSLQAALVDLQSKVLPLARPLLVPEASHHVSQPSGTGQPQFLLQSAVSLPGFCDPRMASLSEACLMSSAQLNAGARAPSMVGLRQAGGDACAAASRRRVEAWGKEAGARGKKTPRPRTGVEAATTPLANSRPSGFAETRGVVSPLASRKGLSRSSSSGSTGLAEGRRGQRASLQQHLVAGGLAGMASRTATAPLETVRLRMMAGGQKSSAGVIARELWQEAGWKAFFKGNLLNVLRAAPQKAIDFCAFETFKSLLHSAFPNSRAELRLAASGALAGGLSTLVLYPLDSVRSRMVVASRGASARQYRSVPHAFATIVKAEGLGSLYKGLAPSLLSILPEAAITYGFHDLFKMMYQRSTRKETVGPLPALVCGVSSAFLGQLVAYPLEVVARQSQVASTRQSMSKVFRKIVTTQGPGGLYNGIVPATAKLIPMAMISFGVYESAKLLLSQAETWQEQERMSTLSAAT